MHYNELLHGGDYIRCIKKQPFLLMESCPSATNWQGVSKLKKPGIHNLSSLQAIAHGSDSVLYFQWRQSIGVSEKFHGAVIDHYGGTDTRVFQEVTQTGEELNICFVVDLKIN
jgi:beta-galactosidase